GIKALGRDKLLSGGTFEQIEVRGTGGCPPAPVGQIHAGGELHPLLEYARGEFPFARGNLSFVPAVRIRHGGRCAEHKKYRSDAKHVRRHSSPQLLRRGST